MDQHLSDAYNSASRLRKEMEAWLDQSWRMDPPSMHGGGEDEANYSLAWFSHYLVTKSNAVADHFRTLRDQLAGWVERECLHGYEGEAEAHHGTEPFLLFLPRYLGLFPEDEKAASLLEDAAHHIGNWVEGIPDWFDWERNRFWGYHIGTKVVNRDLGQVNEIAEHFRFIHIALAAHRVVGDQKYIDWAVRYGRRRAQMICDVPKGSLPIAWGPDGEPVWPEKATESQARAAQAGHHVPGDPLIGVECLLASGAIYVLGDLFEATSEEVFKDAARRIVEPLIGQLGDPYADPGAAAISYYRVAFDDKRYDEAILEQARRFPGPTAGELAMVFPEVRRRMLMGVGKRADQTFWGEWEEKTGNITATKQPSTAALTLAYQLTGDVPFAARALDQAERKLTVARRVLRGGREHADMGGAVCSTAAGHGRNWGWGAVTGCYGPLLLGTCEIKSAVMPALHVRDDAKQYRLPDPVLSLYRPQGETRFYNGGDEPVLFSWHRPGEALRKETLRPGEALEA